MNEVQIAQQAVTLARKSEAEQGATALAAHVGYYLIGEGLPQLQRDIQYRAPSRVLPRIVAEARVPLRTFFDPDRPVDARNRRWLAACSCARAAGMAGHCGCLRLPCALVGERSRRWPW